MYKNINWGDVDGPFKNAISDGCSTVVALSGWDWTG